MRSPPFGLSAFHLGGFGITCCVLLFTDGSQGAAYTTRKRRLVAMANTTENERASRLAGVHCGGVVLAGRLPRPWR